MNTIVELIRKYGMVLMFIGFATAVVSLVVLTRYRYAPGIESRMALYGAIAGFVVYVIGRIGVASRRRMRQQQAKKSQEEFNLEDHLGK